MSTIAMGDIAVTPNVDLTNMSFYTLSGERYGF